MKIKYSYVITKDYVLKREKSITKRSLFNTIWSILQILKRKS